MQAGAPAEEKVPARQLEHAVGTEVPVAAKYFPALQLVQTVAPVVVAYWPAKQSVHEVAPTDEKAPFKHFEHAVAPVVVA